MTIAKALARSLKFPDRIPQVGGRTSVLSAMGSLLGSGAQSGMEAYKQVGAAYGPIRRIAQSASLVDWSLYQQTEKAGSIARELVDDATAPARYPGTAIWTLPNPFMTRRQFIFITEMWKIQAGGVYWIICNRDPTGSPFPEQPPGTATCDYELWPVREERIIPVPSSETAFDGAVAGYYYRVGTEHIPLPVQAVIPLGWPDPLNPLRFAGPLQSIMTDLEAENYASQYNRNTFLNDGRPGGIIEFETPLSPDRFDELVLRWREQHQGVNNVKRVAIIEGGKWVDVGQRNADLEYDKLRHLSRETVMFALGMPFAMMQTNDVNLANATMAEKLFYRWTLRPELEDLKEPLNLRVLPLIGEMLTMDYDLPAPEDEAFDIYAGSIGWLSGLTKRNEGRSALGYDADEDWDGYITDLPNVAASQPAMMPVRPPRRPTNLSYRSKAHEAVAANADAMTEAWGKRLELVRRQYTDLVASRNGTH